MKTTPTQPASRYFTTVLLGIVSVFFASLIFRNVFWVLYGSLCVLVLAALIMYSKNQILAWVGVWVGLVVCFWPFVSLGDTNMWANLIVSFMFLTPVAFLWLTLTVGFKLLQRTLNTSK